MRKFQAHISIKKFLSQCGNIRTLQTSKKYPDENGYCYCYICGNEESKHVYNMEDIVGDEYYSVCGDCLKDIIRTPLEEYYSSVTLNENKLNLKGRFEIMERDGFKCIYCGRKPSNDNDIELQIDHVFPKSKGGSNGFDNLVTSCRECNQGKGDYILKRFRSK